jgi:hypothetical protein
LSIIDLLNYVYDMSHTTDTLPTLYCGRFSTKTSQGRQHTVSRFVIRLITSVKLVLLAVLPVAGETQKRHQANI